MDARPQVAHQPKHRVPDPLSSGLLLGTEGWLRMARYQDEAEENNVRNQWKLQNYYKLKPAEITFCIHDMKREYYKHGMVSKEREILKNRNRIERLS